MRTRTWLGWALAGLTSWICGPAWAQDTGPAGAALPLLNAARAQGCDGRAGQPKSLSAEPRLLRAAERFSRGEELQAALTAEGYKAQAAAAVSLRGYPGARGLAQGLTQRACAQLLNAVWQQTGFYLRGEASWIILATPLTPPQAQDTAQVRAEVLQRVNQARAQSRRCGTQSFASAPALRLNAQLHQAAQLHAADMARHGYFSHTGRDDSQAGQRASRVGYVWQRVGENLAAGQATAAEAVQGWLDSPGHCANLMQPAFTEMGLAYAVNMQSREGIYWVQVLGTPR